MLVFLLLPLHIPKSDFTPLRPHSTLVLFPTISAFGGLARRPAGRLAGRRNSSLNPPSGSLASIYFWSRTIPPHSITVNPLRSVGVISSGSTENGSVRSL